jgi:hypothetical protein
MDSREKNTPYDESDRFDRLVDGELSEAERREFLASMDDEPGKWRKCALAFLEAQAWRESFGELTWRRSKSSDLPTPPKPPVAVPLASPRSLKTKKPLGAMGTTLAMSACFLLALGLGGLLLRSGPGSNSLSSSSPLIAGNNVQAPAIPVVPFPNGGVPGGNSSPKSPASTPWQMVKLRAPSLTGNDEPLQLPAVQRNRLDADFLTTVPNPLPNDVLQSLQRSGHTVSLHRELVPVSLKDGRQAVFPVDQIVVKTAADQTN